MRIMFVTSGGGHLAQLLPLQPWWKDHGREWVTFRQSEVETDRKSTRLNSSHWE